MQRAKASKAVQGTAYRRVAFTDPGGVVHFQCIQVPMYSKITDNRKAPSFRRAPIEKHVARRLARKKNVVSASPDYDRK